MSCEKNKICNCKKCTKKSKWEPLKDVHGNNVNWDSFDKFEPVSKEKYKEYLEQNKTVILPYRINIDFGEPESIQAPK